MPSSCCSAARVVVVATKREALVGDVGHEVLRHFVAVDHLSDADADGRRAAAVGSRTGSRRRWGASSFSVAASNQQRIAAHDEPLAGELVAGDPFTRARTRS